MTMKETKNMPAPTDDFKNANLNARPADQVPPEKFKEFEDRASQIEGCHVS